MPNDINLNTFPSTRTDALTMLYLEKQDLSNITPEQLAAMYIDTHLRISDAIREEHARRKKLNNF